MKIDINNVELSELNKLPLANEKINDIKNYLLDHGKIDDIYELSNISSISSDDLAILKENIFINEMKKTNSLRSNLSYKIENTQNSTYKIQFERVPDSLASGTTAVVMCGQIDCQQNEGI